MSGSGDPAEADMGRIIFRLAFPAYMRVTEAGRLSYQQAWLRTERLICVFAGGARGEYLRSMSIMRPLSL